MVNRILLSLLAISILSTGILGVTPSHAASDKIPDNYIVVLNDGISNPSSIANDMAKQHGLSITHVYGTAIKGYSAVIPSGQLDKVVSDPRVNYVEQDAVVTIDKQPSNDKKPSNPGHGGGGGGGTSDPPQETPTGISLIQGPGILTNQVDVAVIDTGIDVDHPDLNVVGGANFVFKGKNSYDDGNGHGTHVAGTIGAIDNAIGVVGVAPGVNLWAVRVLDNSGSGTYSGVIAGVDWVAAQKDPADSTKPLIEVANMSLGGGYSQALNDAVANAINAGVVFAIAAGNDSADASNYSPASTPEAITVSALDDRDGTLDSTDKFASFSNYGNVIDIIAPGVYIKSTWKGGGYNTISGTSMATPHVAGAAALYLSSHNATPQQVRDYLVNNGNLTWSGTGDTDGIHEPLVYLP